MGRGWPVAGEALGASKLRELDQAVGDAAGQDVRVSRGRAVARHKGLTGIVEMIGPLPQHRDAHGKDLYPTLYLDGGHDSGKTRDLLEILGFHLNLVPALTVIRRLINRARVTHRWPTRPTTRRLH